MVAFLKQLIIKTYPKSENIKEFKFMIRISKEVFRRIFLIGFIFASVFLVLPSCNSGIDIRIGQENAIWTQSIFLRGFQPSTLQRLTDDDIFEYAKTLKQYNIKYAYLFAGPFNKNGYLPHYAFSDTAVNTVKLLRKFYPEIIILPWVGGIQNKTVYLDDSIWVRNALTDSKNLIKTLSVTGLHFDFEFIVKGDSLLERTVLEGGSGDSASYGYNVNEFHRKFRKLMPDAFVSSVVVATSPGTKPWKRKTSLDELKVLIHYVDQLSFLFYDTQINSQVEFEDNCTYLIKDIQNLKQSERILKVQYLIALGTFINEPELQKYRNMDIENIPNTLETLKECLLAVNSNEQIVDGIAIFCEWETDMLEWNQIYNHWTNQKVLR